MSFAKWFLKGLLSPSSFELAKQRAVEEFDREAVETRSRLIERMARALERARNPQWDDEEFEVWWTKDPFFSHLETHWGHFGPGTRKQHVLWEAEQCLKALEDI